MSEHILRCDMGHTHTLKEILCPTCEITALEENKKLREALAVANKALNHVNLPANARFLTLSCRSTVQEAITLVQSILEGKEAWK